MFANPTGREGQVWAQDRGATSAFLNSFMGLDGKPIADEVLDAALPDGSEWWRLLYYDRRGNGYSR